MFSIDLDEMVDSIERHPWIQGVTIYRRFPDTLRIDIQEHQPAILVSAGQVYVGNEKGELFKRLSVGDQLDLPVLTGLDRSFLQHSSVFARRIIRQGIDVSRQFRAHSGRLGRLEELHWDVDLDWSVLTRKSNHAASMRIYLGRRPLRRLALARKIVRKLEASRQVPSVIWADGVKNPDRVHVRLWEAT